MLEKTIKIFVLEMIEKCVRIKDNFVLEKTLNKIVLESVMKKHVC